VSDIIKIQAPESALYMSNFMTELPHGIINKKACGVGGSFIAITNPENYIIAVPTTELIKNKCFQHSDLLGIYSIKDSGVTFKMFKEYIETHKVFKIMTTYDSLPRVVKWLKALKLNVYEDFKLLIDEYHKILSDYSYRDKAIQGLLEESLKFNYYTFLSATPINPKFIPKELVELPYYEIEWHSTKSIKPYRKKTAKPLLHAAHIISNYKANNYSAELKVDGQICISNEAYFFVNSVHSIADILHATNLVPSEVKIICANNSTNRDVLDPFPISSVTDTNKPFTFVTSKSFLGCDFYSESGIVYVISNVNKKHTLLDISTDIFQISGRIRNTNNPFRNILFHIYNTGTSDLTKEEFETILEEKVANTNVQIETFNGLSELAKKANLKRYSMDLEDDYSYYNPDTNLLQFNELKKLNEEFQFSIINDIYTNGFSVRSAYENAGFDVSEDQEYISYEEDFIENMTKISFKGIMLEYCKLADNIENLDLEFVNSRRFTLEKLAQENLSLDIKEIVKKVGTKRIRTLNYAKVAINKELYSKCDEVKDAISEAIYNKLEKNTFYSTAQIKQVLGKIYKDFKIEKTPKAVELDKYCSIRKVSRTVENKLVKGVFIV